MVNLTYGLIDGATGQINTGGTDLIATPAGEGPVAYDAGDIAWVLCCSALVWIMIPGLGYLYSGLVRRKNALTLLTMSLASLCVTSFQWFFWGYSLTFSRTGGLFLGNLRNFGFMKVLELPVPETNNKLPEIVFAVYQCFFAALVPAIVLGAAAERSRFLPSLVFTFVWTTLVYDVLAHAIWSSHGWAFQLGVLDYAGGVPIEIASGTAGLAYSLFIGRRHGYGSNETLFKPQNISNVVLGTVFLWYGWLGFNGGSTFAANLRAAMAIFTTNLAGAVGGLTWMALDFRLERKWSVIGFCTGAICGLVAITPAAGFVGAPAAVLIGVAASAISNSATRLKNFLRIDDTLDIFACHALSGVVGTLLTGIFAQASVANNDAFTQIQGGWLDGNFRQLGLQLAWVCFGLGWTFVVTYLIMFVIDKIPGLHFRASDEAEEIGLDAAEHAEFVQDFVSFRREPEIWALTRKPTNSSDAAPRRSGRGEPVEDLKQHDGEKGEHRGRVQTYSKERTATSSEDEITASDNGTSRVGSEKPTSLRLRSLSRGRKAQQDGMELRERSPSVITRAQE